MQINPEFLDNKKDKIVIDYNPKGKQWIREFVNKVINLNPQPKKNKAK